MNRKDFRIRGYSIRIEDQKLKEEPDLIHLTAINQRPFDRQR